MQTLITLFPLIVLAGLYVLLCVVFAAFVKLSARFLGGIVVSWKHSFIFALVMALLTLFGRTMAVAGGSSIPLALDLAFSFALCLILGGWYFGTRGIDKNGQPLGWVGGMRLSAVAFVLLVLIDAIASRAVHVFATVTKS